MKDDKNRAEEIAAARADRAAPFGKKGTLDPEDIEKIDRAAKISIKALDAVVRNLTLKKFTKETRELALLAQLELTVLYE